MTNPPLTWSEPQETGWAAIETTDGRRRWRIVPVPGDVARIHFTGQDSDGLIVVSTTPCAHGESAQEAQIVVDALRADPDMLPDWREQLAAAGFERWPAEASDDSSTTWRDRRTTGRYEIVVKDAFIRSCGSVETSVEATYEGNRSSIWHNVCRVDATGRRNPLMTAARYRGGLPEGADPLKAGVAAAIAIRDARNARGGPFSKPLGGATKARKRA